MIGRLKGEVADLGPDLLVLDVGGVGYEVLVPARTAASAAVGAALTLHIRTIVREDAITLYGFGSAAEKECFDLLITVNGVGARIALSALSAFAVDELSRAINGNDLRALCTISGVGKKTAERMVLELKGKLAFAPIAVAAPRAAASDPLPLALAQLGYKKSEIDAAIAWLADEKLAERPLDARLAASLRYFASAANPPRAASESRGAAR
jgi:Holliday junction DNA helicase RuvA